MTIEPLLIGYVGFVVASAAIDSLPEPDTLSTKRYRWLYGFLHSLVGICPELLRLGPALNGIPQPLPPGSAVEHKETQITTVVTP